ncbi:hypothetical protein [Streptomyces sp. NPDC048442]|uniref:hypothetical protein n=1 Tax=Streptomyces sp. NPDC048442 TaxID=3154823 RepID=UPI003413DB83
MEQLTYDPVLDSQTLPRWRLMNPLRPPEPGKALVLVPDDGSALVIRAGEEIAAARFGTYQSVFTVDMTEHRLVLDMPLLSRDVTFSFRGRVVLVCCAADPAEVVRRGIRDMSGTLYGPVRRMLRQVSRNFDIAEFHEAEQALNEAVREFTGDSAVQLRNIQIELLVDEDEIAASGRAYRDVVRETRLDGMRRKRHLDMLRDEGVEGLIAEIMEKEGARAALAWIEKGEAEKREARREMVRLVLERGDAHREPFEQAELERTVVEEALHDNGSLFDDARRGRLRGSLGFDRPPAPGAGDPERPRRTALRGEVLADREAGLGKEPDRGSGLAPEPDRRGGLGPEPDRGGGLPPEDEPLPPSAARSRIPSAGSRTDPAVTASPAPEVPATEPPRRVSRVRGTAKRPADGRGPHSKGSQR